MNSIQASRITGGNAQNGRKVADLYPTPPEVTEALMDFLKLPMGTKIWEPASGENDMVNVMRAYGYEVIGTDINRGVDFLTADRVVCDWIITNPPFSLAEKFIERCIESKKPFALLLKSQYWHAQKRYELFNSHKPRYVLPLTWRPDFMFKTTGKGAPLMDVMWVIWDSEPAEVTEYCPIRKGSGRRGLN